MKTFVDTNILVYAYDRGAGDKHVQAQRAIEKLWEEGSGEPDAWQIDCLDAAGTHRAGTAGVWSKGPGIKLWDDLEVRPLGD